MGHGPKNEDGEGQPSLTSPSGGTNDTPQTKTKNKPKRQESSTNKRRCVSTACIACRRRKSKCDGNLPKCAACASVYLTDCEYAPHTDHRRKGVYKKDIENMRTKSSTLQILIQAILNLEEEDAFDLVRKIRSCDNLEELAQTVENREKGIVDTPDSPIYNDEPGAIPRFEAELSGKMGDLVIDGSVRFIGGTSNLIWLNDNDLKSPASSSSTTGDLVVTPREEALLSWTTVTQSKDLVLHFMNMYFCWHYAYFTTLSKELFYRDFLTGTRSQYCSPLLVNVMLALGCHFSSRPAARADPEVSSTTGDHFFAEAKRLLHENDEFLDPKLCTVQALALMSVREAGCGRESKGWVYSGMGFRLASELGLNVNTESIGDVRKLSDEEIDARRITFWGCYLFDKCWSNYLGRQPQLSLTNTNVKKPEVFPSEDSELWSPYTDNGIKNACTQPARTRAVALQIFKLAEISSDLLTSFYHPHNIDKPSNKQNDLKKLTDIHTRLEAWRKTLPPEMDAKDGQLPQVLLMHMFYQLLYIHLYRPFLKYTKTTSPLPAHVSPRKYCTQAAGTISKLFRLYRRTHGLRQICNIAVYIAHSACTIHLLNLPDKNAARDIIHGIKHLEEIGDGWICARRTMRILGLCAEKWDITLPEEAQASLARAQHKWGLSETPSAPVSPEGLATMMQQIQPHSIMDAMPPRETSTHAYIGQLTSASDMLYQDQPVIISADTVTHPTIAPTSKDQNLAREDGAPVSEMQASQDTSRARLSTQLTQQQQEMWDSYQARMGHATLRTGRAPHSQPVNAASLFGGVHSLVDEPQNWWYHDQSQLALGFDNWNTSPSAEWSTLAGISSMAPQGNLEMQMAPHRPGNEEFMNSHGAQMSGSDPSSTSPDDLYSSPSLHPQHAQDIRQTQSRPPHSTHAISHSVQDVLDNMTASNKRSMSFGDGRTMY